ncbi:DUF4153 domain-containing protein [Glycomyces artemisiae]|uniref:Uncharacterized protein DUF4173 n=1 Tax=Glycomyces artemisiae TaxID=1076443 RepID=A0A2T0UKD3_9ACTN|nr:DUF4173 domain-containing protein [Glycomyces artemisiae]PRY58308.1 uncharacterized protein DUF4173 [Glycomyces artemisiae]
MSEPDGAPAPQDDPAAGDSPAEAPEAPEPREAPEASQAPEATPQAEQHEPQAQRPPVQQGVLVPAPPPQMPHQHRGAPYQQQYYAAPPPPPMILPNPRWHRPELSASQTTVILVFVVALFGAWAAFPGGGVGVGLALTGIALVAVPLLTSRDDLLPRLPGAVLVVLLWSVAAVRDAGWVVALCALAAFALTPLVLAPQRRIGGTALAMCFAWLEGIAESFRWARRGRTEQNSRNPGTVRIAWTAGVTVALLLVFGGLFAAADSTFADLVARLLPDLNPIEVFLRLVLAAVLVPLVLVWAYTAAARPRWDAEEQAEHRTVSRFELAIPLAALNLLFAAFIAVQLRVYFGGEAYVMETAGLTFAEYARRGFWQLSFVAVLSLALIAIAAWLAPKRSKADRWTVRVLLALLALMSMAVVVSATYRMYTYTETYGLTRLRVWIFTVEFWLAVLFAMVLVGCWKLRAAWLPRAVLASGAIALLGLAAVNPDALIARYNIDHDHELDLNYLKGLSADAAPEFADLPAEDRDCLLGGDDFDDERDVMAWNWGYQRAIEAAEGAGEPDPYCTFPDWDVDAAESSEVDLSQPNADPDGFWHWNTCAEYDLAQVTEFFGTSATGDRGLVPDDPSQYAEDLDPAAGLGNRVLHCGYYGPGSRYLMIETFEWTTSEDALAGVAAMQAADEAGGIYEVTDIAEIDTEATAGYVAVLDGEMYQYTEVTENLATMVSLSDTATDGTARPVCDDLAAQSYELHYERG